jgi:hypothetical protein
MSDIFGILPIGFLPHPKDEFSIAEWNCAGRKNPTDEKTSFC